jgi:hypothetical protein
MPFGVRVTLWRFRYCSKQSSFRTTRNLMMALAACRYEKLDLKDAHSLDTGVSSLERVRWQYQGSSQRFSEAFGLL